MAEIMNIPYGDLNIGYIFRYTDTSNYFRKYRSNNPYEIIIQLGEKEINKYKWLIEGDFNLAFNEYLSLMVVTGNMLLKYDRCLFHGCAFIWKDKVWIFTAPSGMGKTTQLLNWRRIFGKDVQVINGDKPLLVWEKDNTFTVYSSPWEGKEHLGYPNVSAKLGGIIYLKQGQNNQIRVLNPSESVPLMFSQFISLPNTEEEILKQGEILRNMIKNYPIWELENKGDYDSAYLTHKTLENYLEQYDAVI